MVDLSGTSVRSERGGRKVLGVVGTLVWDSIHQRDGRGEPVEEWGGIGYALEALTVSLPEEWDILPIMKVGKDLSEPAFRFLRSLPRVLPEPGIVVVPEDNNRVELRYHDGRRRCERLSGGVPPWSWLELSPLVGLCDALYVNFISGFEMELETARSLRSSFRGPTYADLHSLFLGMGLHGDRIPRPLPHATEWLHSFDAVQMNDEEFDLLGRNWGDPWGLAASVVGPELKLITVTMGEKGAAYVAGAAFDADPLRWPESRHRLAAPGTTRSGRVESADLLAEGDPTGCGDVWGATLFGRLLAGDSLESAMAAANRMAGRNVSHRGARGLRLHLQGRVAAGGEMR